MTNFYTWVLCLASLLLACTVIVVLGDKAEFDKHKMESQKLGGKKISRLKVAKRERKSEGDLWFLSHFISILDFEYFFVPLLFFFHQENDFLYCVHCTVHCTLLQYTNNIFLFIIIFLLSLDITPVPQYCTVYCINAYFISFKMLKDIFVINNLKWYQIQHQMIFIESRSDLRQLKHGFFCFVTCIHFSRVCRYIKDDKS